FLNGVAAVATNDVWAVGYYLNGGVNQTLTEHWNGSAWSIVASPNQGSSANTLSAVAVVGANDVWAVGDYYDTSTYQTLIEHYNDPCLTPTATPTSTRTAPATPTVTPTVPPCGPAWRVVSSPNVGPDSNDLHAVAAVSSRDVWA